MADHALELQYDSVLKSAKIIFNHTSTYSFKLNLVSILLRSNHGKLSGVKLRLRHTILQARNDFFFNAVPDEHTSYDIVN